MKILVLTTSGFAPTHTSKLLAQIEYLNSFSDMDITVKKDSSLTDTEYYIMTDDYDCVFPTTVFEYSSNRREILSFNRRLYQILEYHCQAYIGSQLFVHMLLNDKALTNYRCGMSLPSILLTRGLWKNRNADAVAYIKSAPIPMIVKPNTLAASIGISKSSIAYTVEQALIIIEKQFSEFPYVNELLLEQYLINAQEYTVSVTGNGEKKLCSTTALITRTQEYEMFSYQNKNLHADQRTLAYTHQMPEHIRTELKKSALQISSLLNVRDYSRYDFLMDENGMLYLIDANSLPALGSNYLLEYVNQKKIQEVQLFSLILTVFCKRMNYIYPKCTSELPEEILEHIL